MIPPRPISVTRALLTSEAAGGILLIAAAALAIAIANSGAAHAYFEALHIYLGPLSLLHWINDGLMAVFFLLVGLEIKRELIDGALSSPADRTLPFIAAAAGMVVPAAIYLAIVGPQSTLSRGWAIPAATDIAFALGVLALLGKRAPASLKLLLTTIAVIDDIGAVVIIALAYTAGLNLVALACAALIVMILFALNKAGEKRLWMYLVLSAALWVATNLSGVHATVAGVVAAFTIPLTRSPGAPDDMSSPLHRLEHSIQPYVAFVILPLFGFANAGVSLSGITANALLSPLPVAIAIALFLGKQIGVFGGVRLAVGLGLARKPGDASWPQVYGMSILCGIGFTMSLFIGSLAFSDPALSDAVKIGVLGGSILSAVAGFSLLATTRSPEATLRGDPR